MKYYCNPINVPYRYQFNADPRSTGIQVDREAADPSMICFKGKYYIFASMNLSVWVSEDLVNWESHRLPENLPLYDYAPDARVNGDYVYFCASKKGEVCDYYRTKDIINGPYEKIEGTFDFWDPNLFFDEDGRVYFYWGCSNETPVWGVELDPITMKPLGERIPLISGNPFERGYERMGVDNSIFPNSQEAVEQQYQGFLKMQHMTEDMLPKEMIPLVKGMLQRNLLSRDHGWTNTMVNIICSMRVREQNTMSMQTEFMFPGHHLDHLHWQRIIHIRIMRVDLCRAQDMALRCGI